ncbi:MAG: minor capsid protein [Lachnospiraceae bacterium]|nr:minor capsid protein [Lachnospiraceae bacterium]
MNSQKYWEERTVWNMYEDMQKAEAAADVISAVYLKSSRWLQLQIEEIFEKYQTKYGLSETEARKLLSEMDSQTVQEMLQKLKNGESDKKKKDLLAELEAPAYRFRIQKLSDMMGNLDSVMQEVYQQEQILSTSFYESLAKENYYRSIFETQKKSGYAFSFNHISSKQIDKYLSINWSGQHYSSRIWKNTRNLAKVLREELLVSLLTGRTERETSEMISNKFSSGALKARRLVRTESCFVSTELTVAGFKECGVEKYRFLATLDLKTSKICRSLDGKVFLMSERKQGINCPPLHPWCRSCILSIISEELLNRMKRWAYDPKTGRSDRVLASMTYEEWYKKYVKGNVEAEAQEKAIRNYSSDKKQYERYREILGKDVPDSFDKFQQMKYNEPEKYQKTHIRYLDEKQRLKIKSDETIKMIEAGKQGKHIIGHNNYISGRSYLTVSMEEAQQLVNKYAGTGVIPRDSNHNWKNREIITADKNIGINVDPVTGEETVTRKFVIHYSKNGTHIVPGRE